MPDDHTSKEQSTALARLRADYSWPRSRPTAAPQMNHGWLDPSTQGFLKAALTRDVRLVVELGSWLGLSTRFLAEHAPQATVIAIDHWRGSPEHHSNPEWAAMLERLFDTFLASCWDYRTRMIPLRVTTLDGLCILARRRLAPDVIYVDADHSSEAVAADFDCALERFPAAAIVGDDWGAPSVRRGVLAVAERRNLRIEAQANAWRTAGIHARQASDRQFEGVLQETGQR